MAVINPPDQKETGKTHLSAVSGLLAILKCCLTLKKVDCTIVRTLWSPRCFVTHVNSVDRPTPMVKDLSIEDAVVPGLLFSSNRTKQKPRNNSALY